MIDTQRLIKASLAWISILYVVCFGAVALYPQIRPLFARYAFHIEVAPTENVVTLATFVAGLVLWNIAVAISLGLFAVLYNRIR